MTAEKTGAPVPLHRRSTREIERALGDWMRRHLPHAVTELVMFVLKLGWASLFGGLPATGAIARTATGASTLARRANIAIQLTMRRRRTEVMTFQC